MHKRFKRSSRQLVNLLILLPILASSNLTKAQTPRVDCSKATSTVEIKYCSLLSYQAADKKLNQAYAKVLSTTTGEQRQLLTTSQQAWIKFRDNNCDFEVYQSRGGTGYEIFRNGCLERLTKQRTKDFTDFLSSK